jgi:hypothetical protein
MLIEGLLRGEGVGVQRSVPAHEDGIECLALPGDCRGLVFGLRDLPFDRSAFGSLRVRCGLSFEGGGSAGLLLALPIRRSGVCGCLLGRGTGCGFLFSLLGRLGLHGFASSSLKGRLCGSSLAGGLGLPLLQGLVSGTLTCLSGAQIRVDHRREGGFPSSHADPLGLWT